MQQPIIPQPNQGKDIHEMICLNAYKYKIQRDDDTLVGLDVIKLVVLKYFKMKESDFSSDKRFQVFVNARSFYCGLAKNLTKFSLKTIGLSMGGRDHSTVLHNIQRFTDLFFQDTKWKQVYDNMKADILDKPIPHPENYIYKPVKSEKLTRRQIELLREKAYEIEESPAISHTQNNNGYSHNHDKIYQ